MTIRVKKLHQESISNDELTSLLALTLLCEDFNDREPQNPKLGSGWLRWGDAVAAGHRGKPTPAKSN